MGFKSIINEWYARDISKKTRSTFLTMAQKGQFVGAYAAYGYMKDPADKYHLVPNLETAPIVQRMFAMAAQGQNLESIRRQLHKEGILTPRAYLNHISGKFPNDAIVTQYPTEWSRNAVYHILRNRVYLGHTVSQKQTKKSFKSKKVVHRPEDEWIEVQHTHESLVEEKLFDKVQGFVQAKRRRNDSKPENIFIGLLRCADCGYTLTLCCDSQRNTKVYYCNKYRHAAQRCTKHAITLSLITDVVLYDILQKAALAREYADDFEGFVRAIANNKQANGAKSQQRELEQYRKRCVELDGIIKRLFEQNAAGVLTDERFIILSGDYETEQRDLKKQIEKLDSLLRQQKNDAENILLFQQIISPYTDVTELTASLLRELIDKIVIHESNGMRRPNRSQKVEIHYRFVGVLPD